MALIQGMKSYKVINTFFSLLSMWKYLCCWIFLRKLWCILRVIWWIKSSKEQHLF